MRDDHQGKSQLVAVLHAIVAFLRNKFALAPETDHGGTIQYVRSEVEFGSGKTWDLVFAILICSIGLNVNSNTVIIGAMLISPIMAPIVGAGFGLATDDRTLLWRSFRNLLLAATVAVVASTLYFSLSPLEDVQSELLSRTRPTIYDILIASFGGGAGAVAVSRIGSKGNVVPGVAIATALMPPLCTVGFGLAQWNLWIFWGALHLFLINALFICLATLVLARIMHFMPLKEGDLRQQRRVHAAIVFITLGITIPSVHTAWIVIQEKRFQQAARQFVQENLRSPRRTVLSVEANYKPQASTIVATMLGPPFGDEAVELLQQRLASYGLKQTQLVLKQPGANDLSVDQLSEKVRQDLMTDLYQRSGTPFRDAKPGMQEFEADTARLRGDGFPLQEITQEVAALYPDLVSLSVGRQASVSNATSSDAAIVVVASWKTMPSPSSRVRLKNFLTKRLGQGPIRLLDVTAP